VERKPVVSAEPQRVRGLPVLAARFARRISWGAIFAGAVMAFAVQILLSVLGMAIGLTAVDPGQGDQVRSLGIGAAIWWTISGIIALFIGGWFASYLAGYPERKHGVLHGLITWGLCTLAGLLLVGTMLGGVLSGTLGVAQAGMAGAAPQAGQAARDATRDTATVDELRQQGREVTEQARDVASRIGEQAREKAEPAAKAGAAASYGVFAMLLLGAAAAAFGGSVGTPKRAREDITREENVEHY
jgi:hypothetical protein